MRVVGHLGGRQGAGRNGEGQGAVSPSGQVDATREGLCIATRPDRDWHDFVGDAGCRLTHPVHH